MEIQIFSFVIMVAAIIAVNVGWIGPEKKSIMDIVFDAFGGLVQMLRGKNR